MKHAEDGFSNRVPTKGIPTGLRGLVMNRRRFLGVAAGIAGLSGCLNASSNGVMPEGEVFMRFDRVSEEFSGTIRIVPDCRDDDVEIQITDGQPDNSAPYERNEHGEECSFDFYTDGLYRESLSVTSSTRESVSIGADGEVGAHADDIT